MPQNATRQGLYCKSGRLALLYILIYIDDDDDDGNDGVVCDNNTAAI